MNIFLSWSGDTSKQIAEVLKTWLPSVIQSLKPFYSPDDISKGKRWSGEISKELSSTDFGILIMTKENVSAPWIMFEGGALSKNIETGRVCTFLFGLKDTDIKGPLTLFQNTKFTKTDVQKLLVDINNYLGDKAIDSKVLTTVFNKMWPDLDKDIKKILADKGKGLKPDEEIRPDRELIEESLRLLRRMNYKHILFDNDDFEFDSEVKVVLNKKNGNISFYDRKKELYWIHLHQLNSTAEILDFIFQISRKGWCKSKHIEGFINCLEEVSKEYFGTNAQGVFSPFGATMSIDWETKTTTKMKVVDPSDAE
jgi:hypothetical protein